MATTTVRKGANRASSAARTRKAAQRTTLPPKGARQRTPAEVAESDAERRAAVTGSPDMGAARSARKGENGPTDQVSKAAVLSVYAVARGWQAEYTTLGKHSSCVATRNDETVVVNWEAEVFVNNATHTVGGRTVKLRNASAAKSVFDTPATAVKRIAERQSRKLNGSGMPSGSHRKVRLPFDPATATDAEVCGAFAPGSRIVWVNRITGNFEEARVYARADGKGLRTVGLTGEAESRTITFPSSDSGVRSVRLEQLIAVTTR